MAYLLLDIGNAYLFDNENEMEYTSCLSKLVVSVEMLHWLTCRLTLNIDSISCLTSDTEETGGSWAAKGMIYHKPLLILKKKSY